MFQIESVDKCEVKHQKKPKNSFFFKVNLMGSDEYGKMKGNFDKSNITSSSPNKSKNKSLIIKKIERQ